MPRGLSACKAGGLRYGGAAFRQTGYGFFRFAPVDGVGPCGARRHRRHGHPLRMDGDPLKWDGIEVLSEPSAALRIRSAAPDRGVIGMPDTPAYPYATHLNVYYPPLEVVDVPA